MSRKEEIDCLNKVKKSLYKPITSYLGDSKKVIGLLKAAKPNENETQFPDFVFHGGFIEHFQVTAAKETAKGSEHRINQAQFDREQKEGTRILKEELEKSEPSNTIKIDTMKRVFDNFDYALYKKSFQKNWEKHICSLNKYTGEKDIGIFLVEYSGALLRRMQKNEFKGFYRLIDDAYLLNYIAEYANQIQYVIYTDGQYHQIIESKNVCSVIQNIPEDIYFEKARNIWVKPNIFIDITNIDGEFRWEKRLYE